MQRRAAALYFALFLVIGAGSYAYVTMDSGANAQQPTITLNAQEYSQNDPITVDGRTYIVSEISAENASDAEGTLTWTNQSAQESATLENGSETTYQNETWQVQIANTSDVSQFALQENLNVSAILASDDRVDNQTVTRNGQEQVVFTSNDTLVPLNEYLREPQTVTFSEGQTYNYTTEDGTVQPATIDTVTGNVSTPSATLVWETTQENTVQLAEGANVTLADGQTRVVHFPDGETVQLSTNYGAYQEQVEKQDYFDERKKGLWGVSVISFLAAIILLATAYLPVKD
ncbi:hypothetical protein ACFR9U_13630 [Halorientalis brevis]|uniref:DUF3068 domain-containing protein n=1 Tax=Halorientalis brevis TaxID=1126241 RepID=A0ABD6CDK8_9EURY|nr:hypothetical protein [Halorientalis brevis]